ncbi:MAG: HAD family hydrolase [Candidatus Woesearchaeota archaeon]
MIKGIVFDLDNTLEEFTEHEEVVEQEMASLLQQRYGIDPVRFVRIFDMIKTGYLHSRSLPQDYGRDVWFKETLAHFDVFDADIASLVDMYWDLLLSKVQLYQGVPELLADLKRSFRLGILSDSDGDRYWKEKRIKQLHIGSFFDAIVTSDDVGANKPHPRGFIEVCKQLGVLTSQAVMVGDHPEVDHVMAKELGMVTVWVTEGLSEQQKQRSYEYVDYVVDKVSEVGELVEKIAQE